MEKIRRLTGVTLNHYSDRTRPGDQLVYITDYSKLRSHTGWKPQITVEQTLKLLQEFWQENQTVTMRTVADYTEPSWTDVQALERAS
jgi:dTDP-D-glucose 4,6-dehydratase